MICMLKVIHYCSLMFLRTLEICVLIYMNFILQISFSSRISMARSFQKDQSKISSFNWYWYVFNIRKRLKGGICSSIYRYAAANTNYMKVHDKNKESSYLQYWDIINLFGWTMSQKLPVNNFEWIKNRSIFNPLKWWKFNEDFIKNYNEESEEGYFLTLMLSILKNYSDFIMIYRFYLKEWNLKKLKSL